MFLQVLALFTDLTLCSITQRETLFYENFFILRHELESQQYHSLFDSITYFRPDKTMEYSQFIQQRFKKFKTGHLDPYLEIDALNEFLESELLFNIFRNRLLTVHVCLDSEYSSYFF